MRTVSSIGRAITGPFTAGAGEGQALARDSRTSTATGSRSRRWSGRAGRSSRPLRSTLPSVSTVKTNRPVTMSAGMSVQRTSSRLLPCVWAGSSVSRRACAGSAARSTAAGPSTRTKTPDRDPEDDRVEVEHVLALLGDRRDREDVRGRQGARFASGSSGRQRTRQRARSRRARARRLASGPSDVSGQSGRRGQ